MAAVSARRLVSKAAAFRELDDFVKRFPVPKNAAEALNTADPGKHALVEEQMTKVLSGGCSSFADPIRKRYDYTFGVLIHCSVEIINRVWRNPKARHIAPDTTNTVDPGHNVELETVSMQQLLSSRFPCPRSAYDADDNFADHVREAVLWTKVIKVMTPSKMLARHLNGLLGAYMWAYHCDEKEFQLACAEALLAAMKPPANTEPKSEPDDQTPCDHDTAKSVCILSDSAFANALVTEARGDFDYTEENIGYGKVSAVINAAKVGECEAFEKAMSVVRRFFVNSRPSEILARYCESEYILTTIIMTERSAY